jgi:hypothetical protein
MSELMTDNNQLATLCISLCHKSYSLILNEDENMTYNAILNFFRAECRIRTKALEQWEKQSELESDKREDS